MGPVEEIQPVNDRLIFWQSYEPAVKVDLSSHAFFTPEGWLLIDPIPLRDGILRELIEQKNVAAILLTNGNHGRAAADFKTKCHAPIIAHAGARGEFPFEADRWIQDGEVVSGLTAIHLPGFAAGELALFSSEAGGTMIVGDALIHLQPHGFAILPGKYCSEPKLARKSLQKLLQFPFEIMTFAHGLPIVAGAKRRLETLLQ